MNVGKIGRYKLGTYLKMNKVGFLRIKNKKIENNL